MFNRREILSSLCGLLTFGLVKNLTAQDNNQNPNVYGKGIIMQKLLVYSFIVKAYKDDVLNTMDLNTFECYFDPTLHRQQRYGWYAFMTYKEKDSNETYKVASSIDVKVELLSVHEVGCFIGDARALLNKTVERIKSNSEYIKQILEEIKQLQTYELE